MSHPCERPLECGQCKKTIKITYKEIVGSTLTCTSMCGECPMFQLKLHGEPTTPEEYEHWKKKDQSVCCGKCSTPLEAVKMGQPLGCVECYSIFDELLTHELLSLDRIAPRMKASVESKKTLPIHIGKSPDKERDVALSQQLTTLNEALNEALKKENYEQAAWLRDQIKALMEKPENGKNKAS